MITIIDAPFLTEKTARKIDRIKTKIKDGKFNSSICAIAIASNDVDVFDIVPLFCFKFRKDIAYDIVIVGFAENKKAAIKMCSRLASEYLKDNTACSMRAYFEEMLLK